MSSKRYAVRVKETGKFIKRLKYGKKVQVDVLNDATTWSSVGHLKISLGVANYIPGEKTVYYIPEAYEVVEVDIVLKE